MPLLDLLFTPLRQLRGDPMMQNQPPQPPIGIKPSIMEGAQPVQPGPAPGGGAAGLGGLLTSLGPRLMLASGDPGYIKVATELIKQQREAELQNQTARYMISKGVDPQAAMIMARDPEATRAWIKKGQEPWKFHTIFTDDGREQHIIYNPNNPEEFKLVGGPKTDVLTPQAEQQKIKIAQAGATKQVGSIPPGYRVQYDEKGQPVQMEAVPGSPAAFEEAERARKMEKRERTEKLSADLVTQEIDRSINLIKTSKIPITGFGSIASAVPGTPAHDLARLIDSIKANVSFDKLQAMRDASPTGGALGPVSDFENRMLQQALGSLEQSQTREQLLYNLERLRGVYLDIIHGPGNRPGQKSPGAGAIPPPPPGFRIVQ